MAQAPRESGSIGAADVAAYLRAHPRFLADWAKTGQTIA